MKPTPERPLDPQADGISLDALGEAFANALGRPRVPDDEPTAEEAAGGQPAPAGGSEEADKASRPPAAEAEPVDAVKEQPSGDPGGITPRSIVEAILFVGNRHGEPLSAERVAEPIRGVEPREIAELVDQLNRGYRRRGGPYEIVSRRGGYRMALRPEYRGLRDRFYGRVREARLSQAAIDTLALVAYRQPLSAEQVGGLRGKSSGHVLSQLVRRGLLRIERRPVETASGGHRRVAFYRTTDRFLRLFSLESLDDLPRSEELEQ